MSVVNIIFFSPVIIETKNTTSKPKKMLAVFPFLACFSFFLSFFLFSFFLSFFLFFFPFFLGGWGVGWGAGG